MAAAVWFPSLPQRRVLWHYINVCGMHEFGSEASVTLLHGRAQLSCLTQAVLPSQRLPTTRLCALVYLVAKQGK